MQIALFVSSSDAVQPGWLLKFLKGISLAQIRGMQRNLAKVCDSIKVYIISDFFYFCCCLIVQVNDILIFIVLLPIEITKPTKYLPNQPFITHCAIVALVACAKMVGWTCIFGHVEPLGAIWTRENDLGPVCMPKVVFLESGFYGKWIHEKWIILWCVVVS